MNVFLQNISSDFKNKGIFYVDPVVRTGGGGFRGDFILFFKPVHLDLYACNVH
jgi:hypothetical protein